MELTLILPAESSPMAAIQLKDFIENSYIKGLQKTETTRTVTMVLEAAQKPLCELIRCLQKYDFQRTGRYNCICSETYSE